MRLVHFLFFIAACSLAFGAVTARKPAARKAAIRKSSKSRPGTKKVAATGYYRQQTPSTDRYREIQQALADRGYLKSEPTGAWGPESVDALKQFQAEKNLPVTGKLSSLSLIGLGLGPKTASTTVLPPAATTAQSDPGVVPNQ